MYLTFYIYLYKKSYEGEILAKENRKILLLMQ